MNCLSVFYHFVGLALKELINFLISLTGLYLGHYQKSVMEIFVKVVMAQESTAQKMKFSIINFSSKSDQIPSFVLSHLPRKSVMEICNFFVQ